MPVDRSRDVEVQRVIWAIGEARRRRRSSDQGWSKPPSSAATGIGQDDRRFGNRCRRKR